MRVDNRLPDVDKVLRADNVISALDNMTPAQINAWIDTNVTDLASAKTVLKMLVKVAKYLIEKGVIQR